MLVARSGWRHIGVSRPDRACRRGDKVDRKRPPAHDASGLQPVLLSRSLRTNRHPRQHAGRGACRRRDTARHPAGVWRWHRARRSAAHPARSLRHSWLKIMIEISGDLRRARRDRKLFVMGRVVPQGCGFVGFGRSSPKEFLLVAGEIWTSVVSASRFLTPKPRSVFGSKKVGTGLGRSVQAMSRPFSHEKQEAILTLEIIGAAFSSRPRTARGRCSDCGEGPGGTRAAAAAGRYASRRPWR